MFNCSWGRNQKKTHGLRKKPSLYSGRLLRFMTINFYWMLRYGATMPMTTADMVRMAITCMVKRCFFVM